MANDRKAQRARKKQARQDRKAARQAAKAERKLARATKATDRRTLKTERQRTRQEQRSQRQQTRQSNRNVRAEGRQAMWGQIGGGLADAASSFLKGGRLDALLGGGRDPFDLGADVGGDVYDLEPVVETPWYQTPAALVGGAAAIGLGLFFFTRK